MATLLAGLQNLGNEIGFSGVVAVYEDGARVLGVARGLANRATLEENTIGTQFGTASATKGLTALMVCSLIESGELKFETKLRSLLGVELPLVSPLVTVEQLLSHVSGVGDYLDEEKLGDIDELVLDISVEDLDSVGGYLPLLKVHPQKSVPGVEFAYNNSGYVILSIAAEAVARTSFYQLVHDSVLEPAGMLKTAFLRSDELPPTAALGYLKDGRLNDLHLPVRGAGDGGIYSTVDDIERLWSAMFSGAIVSSEMVGLMIEPRNEVPSEGLSYGLGFWLRPETSSVILQGMDAGVSFWSSHNMTTNASYTIISNSSTGAWPMARYLSDRMGF